jgi:hypothetical protein
MRQFVRGVYEAASSASEMTDRSKSQLARDLDFMDSNMQLNAALHTLNNIQHNGAQGLSPEGGVFLAKAAKLFNEYSRENPNEADIVIAFGEFNSSLAELNNQGTAKEIFDVVTDAVKINKGIGDSQQNFNQIQEEATQRFAEFDQAMRDTEHKIAIIDDKIFHATGGAQGARFNGEPSPNVFTRIGELADRIGAGLARVRANITP